MGKKDKDFRFIISDGNEHSNVWKVSVRKNDVYLMSRSFGKGYKISKSN